MGQGPVTAQHRMQGHTAVPALADWLPAPWLAPPGAHLHLGDKGLGAVGAGGRRGGAGKAQGLGEHAEQCWPARGCCGVPQRPVDQPFPQAPPAAGEVLLQDNQVGGWWCGDHWVSLHVSPPSTREWPHSTHIHSLHREGRKGDVQMGGVKVLCTPATGRNNLPPASTAITQMVPSPTAMGN